MIQIVMIHMIPNSPRCVTGHSPVSEQRGGYG